MHTHNQLRLIGRFGLKKHMYLEYIAQLYSQNYRMCKQGVVDKKLNSYCCTQQYRCSSRLHRQYYTVILKLVHNKNLCHFRL